MGSMWWKYNIYIYIAGYITFGKVFLSYMTFEKALSGYRILEKSIVSIQDILKKYCQDIGYFKKNIFRT